MNYNKTNLLGSADLSRIKHYILFGESYEDSSASISDKKKKQYEDFYWDPFGKIPIENIIKNCSVLLWETRQFELKGKRIRTLKIAGFAIGILCIASFIGIIAVGFSILLIRSIKKTIIDIIKYNIAVGQKWFYDPYLDSDRGSMLYDKIKEITSIGDNNYVEDQIWGFHDNQGLRYFFYSGVYVYVVRGSKSSTSYENYFFMIKLPKKLRSTFAITPETAFSKIGAFFSKKEINVESTEFNKMYSFSYNGEKDKKAMDIVRTLSPAVQEQLVKLGRDIKGLHILFKEDTVSFLFEGRLLKKPKSKIVGKKEINEDDVREITDKLDSFVTISSGISRYLD
ncbi:DUF3137 domain-containing protein [Candidatus Woesearchaeota archaeon]|nr:DUF3137 domain-containing protein [Candidatus Woesearchaeota archaeon]